MSDNQQKDNEQPQQHFSLQKIYTKDVSFETPNSPDIFTREWKPDINIEINSKGNKIGDDVHEVQLGVTVTAKLGETVAFLVEVHQAGIFTIKGFTEQDLGAMLGSYCPNLLFPFAREVISDLVAKGGFPQLLLAPVNFDAIYHEHMLKMQQANKNTKPEQQNVH